MWEFYEQLYTNKLDEMDKFLERHKLLKLTQEEKNSMNRSITSDKPGLVILKKLPTKKTPGLDGSPLNSNKHLKN